MELLVLRFRLGFGVSETAQVIGTQEGDIISLQYEALSQLSQLRQSTEDMLATSSD